MIGIGSLIGMVASAFQFAQTLSRSDSRGSKVDQLFSQLDAKGRGAIDGADLQKAFEDVAASATNKADQLFAKLDTNGDGKVTKDEFKGSINRLAEQLDQHYMRLRIQGSQTASAGFSKDELTGLATRLANNFEKIDANQDGRISLTEIASFSKADAIGGQTAASSAQGTDTAAQNAELMLQIVRLIQAYGNATENPNNAKGTQISVSA